MSASKPWTGIPAPYANTFVTYGDLWDYGATIPVGTLSLYRTDPSSPLNLNMVGGGFGYGLDVYTAGIGGDVNLNVIGPYEPFDTFVNSGRIDDLYGTLNINVSGAMTAVNYGAIAADQGNGNQAININLQSYPWSSVNFYNEGQISAVGYSGQGHSSATVNITQQTTFQNDGLISAQGSNAYVSLWSEPPNSAGGVAAGPFLGSVSNNGSIMASGGAVAFISAPVTGTGTLEADSGGRLKFAGLVSSGETVSINSGVLEFGPPGTFNNPAMQFYAPIVGESSSSTILLDGALGASHDYTTLSNSGSGFGELRVYDAAHTTIADFEFVGRFDNSNFQLSPHAAASPSNNWTAISFVGQPTVAHS